MADRMTDEDPVPDSAMDTGSDEGEPGGVADSAPLTGEEQALLNQLKDGGADDGANFSGRSPEESPEAGAAAADDAPLPAYGQQVGSGPDPLDPVFREPEA